MKYFSIAFFALISIIAVLQNPDWLNHPRVEQWNSRTKILISNPHNTDLEHVPVTIAIEDLQLSADDFSPGNFYVYNHKEGKAPLFQVDVPEEEKLDEIVFMASLESGQEKEYYIYYAENGQAWPKQERFTHATDMPGWESEVFGYRSYGPFALDLFARNQDHKGLMLDRFYNAENEQIYNYHEGSEFGLDILHLSSTAGLAGVGFYQDKKVNLVGAPFESEVVASGPVRSIVQMDMQNWQTDFGTVSISRQATIYAHHYETEIEDHVTGINNNALYAVGIRKVKDSNSDMNKKQGLFIQWQNQGDDIGEAGIGLYVKPRDIERIVEDEGNNFVLTQPPVNQPLHFWAFGAWKRGEDINNFSDFQDRAERIKQLQLPIKVTVDETQYPTAGN